MNEKTIQLLNQTDVEVLHGRFPAGSRQYHEVQQTQAVQAASSRWHLLAEVRDAGVRTRERGR